MIFENIRSLLCPFEKIEPHMPSSGDCLDIGCGHGTFAKLLAETSSERIVLGIDPSKEKVEKAKSSSIKLPNLTFKQTNLQDLKTSKFDAITIIDVLYLLDKKQKRKMLKKCKKLLKKNGILLVKELHTKPSWMFSLSKLQEFIMVNSLSYTYSVNKYFYFYTPEEYTKFFKDCGFELKDKIHFFGKLHYPSHVLFVLKLNK